MNGVVVEEWKYKVLYENEIMDVRDFKVEESALR
jgi:hypothetical protein